MNPRRSVLLTAAVVAAAIGLAGCTPGPAPTPTPTPLFTSEAEAFKAAEQVFRDYIDAANSAQDDPSADPQTFLAGRALEDDIKSERDLDAAGHRITGRTVVTGYASASYDPDASTVKGRACLDVTNTQTLDAQGRDITKSSRAPVVAVDLTFAGIANSLKIVSIAPSKESCP